MNPTLCMGQFDFSSVFLIRRIPIREQYVVLSQQSERGLHMMTAPRREERKVHLVLLSVEGPEIDRVHLAVSGRACLDRSLIHADDAAVAHRGQLRGINRLQQRDTLL